MTDHYPHLTPGVAERDVVDASAGAADATADPVALNAQGEYDWEAEDRRRWRLWRACIWGIVLSIPVWVIITIWAWLLRW